MAREVRNPLFARIYTAMSRSAEKTEQSEHRDELLAGLSGRVAEVGAGNGLNFAHYPETVSEVIAVEPEDYLRAKAEEAAREARVSVRVVDGLADRIPLDDESVDAAVISLVLCSVPDQQRALAEVRRVIRPGGELRFYEHVRSDNLRAARRQDRITPLWSRCGGGCHPNRATVPEIERAGFEIESRRDFIFKPCFFCAPVAPHVIGVARRR